jgi:drug/metabolite transporter (DMT)-like permease
MLIVLLAVCIALDVARELCFKTGARASLPETDKAVNKTGATKIAARTAAGWSIAGALIWGIEILTWAAVLAQLPLNIAFPIMSLTYAATPLASAVVLGEKINRRRWAGIGLVTAGVAIVGASGIG